jgi:hypothetical protein
MRRQACRTHCPWLAVQLTRPLPPRRLQLPVVRNITAEEGWQALWRGWKPRVLFHVPAAAVCWGTYESVKAMLAVP